MRCASVCEEYLAYCSSHRKKGNPFVYAPQFRQERPKQLPFPSWEIPCPTLKILDDRGFHCFPTVSEFSDKWKLDRNQTHSRLSGIVGDSLENPSQISAITGDHWRGRRSYLYGVGDCFSFLLVVKLLDQHPRVTNNLGSANHQDKLLAISQYIGKIWNGLERVTYFTSPADHNRESTRRGLQIFIIIRWVENVSLFACFIKKTAHSPQFSQDTYSCSR